MNKTVQYIGLLFVLIGSACSQGSTQTLPLSEQMAATAMETLWKDTAGVAPKPEKWTYDQGVVLEGIAALWRKTGDGSYFNYIQKSMDYFVDNDGNIATYKQSTFNIDNVKNGRTLLLLYKVTGKQKYLKAANQLWEQLQKQPRTNEGGFWHKKIYPYQMWLDGLYMGEPFYTEYAALMNKPDAFNDIANQFIYTEKHTRDAKTGLLYHGWDESKVQQWANKTTGTSPNFWARAMGWYIMALVDVLDYFPANHPKRAELLAILNRTAAAALKYQDAKSGVWYDILDKQTAKGNYLEASASSMFVYGFAKGVRMGYLPQTYFAAAKKGYEGLQKEFIVAAGQNRVNLNGTVSVSGLGGKPYRNGSYEYYISEKVITNDPKGVGAFLLAAHEMELAAIPKTGKGKTVLLDNFFNNEYTKGPSGENIPFHYIWNEDDNNGFSLFGSIFQNRGLKLATLHEAPTAANLKGSDIYIIVDPDTEKETEKPNYMTPSHAQQISQWVKAGGVLVLFLNDAGNCEFKNFNQLPELFGIHFNEDSRNKVEGRNFEQGAISIPAGNAIFKTAKKIYIKEISTLNIKQPATARLTDGSDVIIATAKYGKGTVFAVGDPWFYNEYLDGRKLPAQYQNFAAATDLVNWLIGQIPTKK